MSTNPFHADPAIPARLALVSAEQREALRRDALETLQDGVISAAEARRLVHEHALNSLRDLMVLLLDTAGRYAQPSISEFHVGAVGLASQEGDLILAGNVEFPGTHLGFTMHGEGSVFTRAMHLGVDISVIAIGEAHPCAHCRQCLAEYAASDRLELIDPLGHTLTLAQLYPWPFDPAYLGEQGAVPGRELWPDLKFEMQPDLPQADLLLELGRRSHSPYSKCPGALLLQLDDGTWAQGFAIESVAFNPTISPIQSAAVDLLSKRYQYASIKAAVLGTVRGGTVDYTASTTELLSRIAPSATLTVLGWQP